MCSGKPATGGERKRGNRKGRNRGEETEIVKMIVCLMCWYGFMSVSADDFKPSSTNHTLNKTIEVQQHQPNQTDTIPGELQFLASLPSSWFHYSDATISRKFPSGNSTEIDISLSGNVQVSTSAGSGWPMQLGTAQAVFTIYTSSLINGYWKDEHGCCSYNWVCC